jgi:hypothetical protein
LYHIPYISDDRKIINISEDLKIPNKGVIRIRKSKIKDNTIAKRKNAKRKTMIYTTYT